MLRQLALGTVITAALVCEAAWAQGPAATSLGAAPQARVSAPAAAATVKAGQGGGPGTASEADEAARKSEADRSTAAALSMLAAQTVAATRLASSVAPAGKAIEVTGSLTAPDGTVVPVRIVTHNGVSSFNGGNSPLFVAVSVAVTDESLTFHSAVNADGRIMSGPAVTATPGAPATVTLEDGSRMVLNAVVRDATPDELRRWGVNEAQMNAIAARQR